MPELDSEAFDFRAASVLFAAMKSCLERARRHIDNRRTDSAPRNSDQRPRLSGQRDDGERQRRKPVSAEPGCLTRRSMLSIAVVTETRVASERSFSAESATDGNSTRHSRFVDTGASHLATTGSTHEVGDRDTRQGRLQVSVTVAR